MSEISFRQADEGDNDLTFEIKKQSLGPYIEAIWGWNEGEQTGMHRREYDAEHTRIVMTDGEDVGLITLHEKPDALHIFSLLLLPSHQSRGVGTRIVLDLIGEANRIGKAVTLDVFKVNTRAFELYRRLGFVSVGEQEHHIHMRRGTDNSENDQLAVE